MGEGLGVVLDVGAAFEGFAHVAEGFAEGVDLLAFAEGGIGGAFSGGDVAGVVGETTDGAVEPEENGPDEKEDGEGDGDGGPEDLAAAFVDEGEELFLGLVGGGHAHDVAFEANGGADIHHGGGDIVLVDPG